MLKNIFSPMMLCTEDESPAEMYTEEFQEKLSSWFEEQGVISDLRTYLRHHLINVLKQDKSHNKSPDVLPPIPPFKTQAMNLLIAEYLLKNKHYYAFSVFSMEVPLIGIVSAFTKLPHSGSATQLNNNIKSKQFQLSDPKIWDVLAVFGFDPFSIQGRHIHESYLNCIDEPLLIHIVNYSCNLNTGNQVESDRNDIAIENVEDFINSFENILLRLPMPSSTYQHVISYFKRILNQFITKIKADELFKFDELQTQIQNDIKDKEQKITVLINEIETNVLTERQKLLDSLQIEQDQCVFELNNKMTDYKNKLKILKQREHLLVKRENGLLTKLQELESKRIEFADEQTSHDAAIKEMQQTYKLRIEQQSERIQQLMSRNTSLRNDLVQAKETVAILLKSQIKSPCKIMDGDDSMEEILRETKQRLETLKIETQVLDQSFRDYKLRQTQT